MIVGLTFAVLAVVVPGLVVVAKAPAPSTAGYAPLNRLFAIKRGECPRGLAVW